MRERTAYFLDVVGLGDAAQRLPRELSGGMQKRVGLARAIATEPEVILEELYLLAYSRPPSPAESTWILADVAAAEDPHSAWENVFWAVLNSKEFLFNH